MSRSSQILFGREWENVDRDNDGLSDGPSSGAPGVAGACATSGFCVHDLHRILIGFRDREVIRRPRKPVFRSRENVINHRRIASNKCQSGTVSYRAINKLDLVFRE